MREEMDLDICEGDYSYYLMRKRNWNTLDAIKEISERSGINFKRFGYAGNKDKNALTEQHISVFNFEGDLAKFKIKDIELLFAGKGKERINLGMLRGNRFRIVVRDLDEERELKFGRVKNFFDGQRFGIEGKNWKIGKSIVKRDFENACRLIGVESEGRDYIGALRKIERKMLRFYVHSYQSYLFNLVLGRLNNNFEKIPIIGYLTEFEDKSIERIYNEVLKKERIKKENFLIREMNEISSEGSMRKMYCDVQDFSYEYLDDEINNGKKKCLLSFFLGPGQYGTMVVKSLFGEIEKVVTSNEKQR